MTIEQLITFNLILAVALASPGAALVFSLKTSMSRGRAAGIATGIGLGAMASCWTLMALLGLDQVFALFPWAYGTLKIGGALYLMYLAWKTWASARDPLPEMDASRGRAALDGFLVNAANPKSVLFAAAVILVVFPQGSSTSSMVLITLNHFVVEVLFYSTVAVLASTPIARNGYIASKAVLDRIAAGLMGALGLRLILDR